MWQRMRISRRLSLGFAPVIFLFGLVSGGATLWMRTQMSSILESMYSDVAKGNQYLAEAQNALWTMRFGVARYVPEFLSAASMTAGGLGAFIRLACLAVAAAILLHARPSVACGGGSVRSVVETGLGVVVSVDLGSGTVTLDHAGTPYVLKAGRSRLAAGAPGVLDDAAAAEGKRIKFELLVAEGNTTIVHIERIPE